MRRKALIFSLLVHFLFVYLIMTAKFSLHRDIAVTPKPDRVIQVKLVPVKKIYAPHTPPTSAAAAPGPGATTQRGEKQGDDQTGGETDEQNKVPIVVKKFVLDSPAPGSPDGDKSLEPPVGAPPTPDRTQAQTQPQPQPRSQDPASPRWPSTETLRKELEDKPKRLKTPDLSPDSPFVTKILDKVSRMNQEEVKAALPKKHPDFTSVAFTTDGPAAYGAGGDGITAYGGGAYFNIKGYDITPWARRAVYRIKRHWIIPLAASAGVKGEVGIFIVIETDGRISRIETREPSNVNAYDKAAVNAFRLSSPLPPLPADFPNKNLEAYFIFHYN